MSDGFLGRWSKRKLEVQEGKAVEAEPAAEPRPAPEVPPASETQGQAALAAVEGLEPLPSSVSPPVGEGGGEAEVLPETPPVLTLEDVKALTADSDFSRFAAPHVAPEVRNAALKKLFSDPHYNIMDGLDVYIDDYSKPDPMPESMIRQLSGVKFLKLFAREEQEEAEAKAAHQARDDANNPTAQSVAQSEAPPAVPPAVPESADHAHPDLRLQQDHATPGEDPGDGAG